MVSRRVITIMIIVLTAAVIIYGIWWFFNNWDQVGAQETLGAATTGAMLLGGTQA